MTEMETPCIVVDRKVVERNIAAMAEVARENGVKLRPHVKTHKIPEFALAQLEQGAAGITTAKISEAEVMAEHGICDIFIAYPVVTASKIKRVIDLARRIHLTVGVESLAGAQELSRQASAAGIVLEVRLEIDTGLARTGVPLLSVVNIARQITSLPGLDLSGIFTYKGAVFEGDSTLNLQAAGHEEGTLMVEAAAKLKAAGMNIKDVSVGSSPTAVYAAEVKGVTEIRPGTYIFNDRMLMQMGVCRQEDCAARVKVTVISVPAEDRLVIDGGSKTFATDVQPNHPPLNLKGFGEIIGHPDAVLERMNEEHGMIRTGNTHQMRVGDILEIIPNHICSTVNLHNEVYVLDQGITRVAPVLARGKIV